MDEQEILGEALKGFNYSWSYIIGSLIFGVVGLYLFRIGKKRLNYQVIGIGVLLMVYPIFFSSAWLVWGLGCFLSVLAYHYLEQGEF
jgi:hypothetical protein